VEKAKLMKLFKEYLAKKHGHFIEFHIVLVGEGELPRHTIQKLTELGANLHFQEMPSF
jgi:hypothetical protein